VRGGGGGACVRLVSGCALLVQYRAQRSHITCLPGVHCLIEDITFDQLGCVASKEVVVVV
jgi:hypothetical protein